MSDSEHVSCLSKCRLQRARHKETFLTKIRNLKPGLFTVLALLAAASAHAELLVNGGFETGDLSGWTATNLTSSYSRVFSGAGTYAGTYSFYIGEYTNHPLTLSQTVATVIGQQYTFSLELAFSGNSQSSLFSMSQSGSGTPLVTVAAPTTNAAVPYQLYSSTFIADSTSTTVSFSGANSNGVTYVDNVSLTQSASATPEPATFGMFGLAAGVFAWKLRRKPTRA